MSKKLTIIGILIALAITGYFIYGAFATSNPHSWTNGLVGYWSFDGQYTTSTAGTRDVSNNGNWGAFSGGVKPTAGVVGQALSFDGTDDYVDAGTGISTASPITVELWIKPNSASLTSYHDLVGKGPNTAKKLYFLLNNGKPQQFNSISATSTLTADTWYHLVYVEDGTYEYIYINGQQDNKEATEYLGDAAGSRLIIGKAPGSSVEYYSGLMDEVRIYSRALSADEVKQHYDQTRRNLVINNPSGTPPVGWWKLDGGNNETTAKDSSVNGSTGTLYGEMATSSTYGWVDGKIGHAIKFDGTNDYVDMGDTPSYDITNNLTVGAWIKTNALDQISEPGIVSKYETDKREWALRFNDQKISVYFGASGGAYSGYWLTNNNVITSIDDWYHVVFTFVSGTVVVYVNGLEKAGSKTDTIPSTLNNEDYPIRIGGLGAIQNQYFNGTIDEVRIYNYARTADQIAADYRAGAYRTIIGTSVPSTWWTNGLVGYWNFDGPNTTSTNGTRDTSGQNNWGTFYGGVKPAAGVVGQALSFDNVDDYVLVGNIQTLNAITFEAWIKPFSIADNTYMIGRWALVGGGGNSYYVAKFTDDLFIRWSPGGGVMNDLTASNVFSVANVWYHVVWTYDKDAGANNNKAYVDGVLKAQNTKTGSIATLASGIAIGGIAPAERCFFNGSIDEVRIYNRALSADEVLQHYQQTRRNLGI